MSRARMRLAGAHPAAVVAAVVVCLAVVLAACGQSEGGSQSSGATTTTTSSATTTSTAPSTTTTLAPVTIEVTGPTVVERPEGKELFKAAWGKAPGQVGYETEGGAPSQNPILVAVSPDGKTIAVADYANSRVELFGRDGTLQQALSMRGSSAFDTMAYEQDGELYVSTLNGGPVYLISRALSQTFGKTILVEGTWPPALPVPGAATGTMGDGDITYRLVAPATLFLVSSANHTATAVALVSEDLPLDEVRTLTTDAEGDLYLMVRVYQEGWEGTESWCFVGVAPDGTYLGQVRLPLDFYAGGGWTVSPYGKIVELRSTKGGIVVTEYALSR